MPLDSPPRDAAGAVVPHDHAGIAATDGVIRRISNLQIVIDKNTGARRLSSYAFKPSSGSNGGMSVDLQREIEQEWTVAVGERQLATTRTALEGVLGAARADGRTVSLRPTW